TTAAGLLNGINKNLLKTELHVVPVLKEGSFIKTEIAKYANDLSKLHLHTNYHWGGYAKTPPQLMSFIIEFTSKTCVLIDPIYTGKLFYAISDLLHQNLLPKDAKLLAIHTGGLFG